jgi:hypothetical protein
MAKRPGTRPRADQAKTGQRARRTATPTAQAPFLRPRPAAAPAPPPPPVPIRAGLDLRFDLTNPRATEFARTRSSQLVTNITNDVREVIRGIIGDGFAEGRTTRQMAKEIRRVVGLTPRYATAVTNLRDRLEAKGLDADTIDAKAEKYSAKLLRLRAQTIARTETIRASNAGQRELWRQAASGEGGSSGFDEPLINGITARQIWIVTADDRLCPICEAIPDMNSDGVPLGGMFETPDGPVDAPPAHVACRCALALDPSTT